MKYLFNITPSGRNAALLALLMALAPVRAQSHTLDILSPQAKGWLERGRFLLRGGNSAGALDQLRQLSLMASGPDSPLSDSETREMAYMLAMSAFETGDNDAPELLARFVAEYPSSPFAVEAMLARADFEFFKGRFASALEILETVDFGRLNVRQRPLYEYRLAFSEIKCGAFDSAASRLRGLLSDNEFAVAARFYLAYIDYMEGNYDEAYRQFASVNETTPADSERRSSMPRRRGTYVPTGLEAGYYMTHIEYARGEYEDVVSHGRMLLERKPVPELVPEMEKTVGLAYYKLGNYPAARSFLENYLSMTDEDPSDDALYAMGVIDYSEGDCTGARRYFERLTDRRSDIGQSSWLYLGQCSALEGDDSAAAIAFDKAAQMDFDSEVGETALFNYVASRTRGGKVPFSSSIELLERFLAKYPGSRYAPEAESYLAIAYYNEHDYARAMQSIERIPSPGRDILAARQKVAYELGMECLSNSRAAEAEKYFRMAVDLKKYSSEIAVQSTLWLADALYSQKKWSQAEKAYSGFLQSAGRGDNRTLALYGLAYSLYMQDRFEAALRRFSEAVDASPSLPKRLEADARMRLADCRYYTGDYRGAMAGYRQAVDGGVADADYAAYRHAVMRGLGGDIKGKISELDAMENRYKSSRWLPAALLEKGQTLASLGDIKGATAAFENLTRRYPDSPQARKGMLSLAISYDKADRADKAAGAYREVIRNWPTSEEASLANDDLRRRYARSGELDEYADFLSEIPEAPRIDADERERLVFEAAEEIFGRDVADYARLERYVEEYPNGRWLAQALLDIAEGRRESGNSKGALQSLDLLLKRRPDSPQAPEALMAKATLLEENTASRREAFEAWSALERRGDSDFYPDAVAGMMRTTSDSRKRVEYARRVSRLGGLSADRTDEAAYYEAIGLRDSGKSSDAQKILSRLAKNPKSLSGAMAAVALGQMYVDARQYAKAEKVLSDFTDNGTPHQYWLARGFIALADTYRAQGKVSLAREYLISLRDNYPGKDLDIRDMIESRLKTWK